MGGCLAHGPSHVHTYLKILQHCLLTVVVAAFLSKTGQVTHSGFNLIRVMNALVIKGTVKSVSQSSNWTAL